jgi:hypothetical protein
MQDDMKQRLTRRDVWVRALYMVFFFIAYSIAELLLGVVVLLQFVIVLLTGSANENLLRLGNNLTRYIYQVFRFQTFNTEEQAFPFSDWPDEPVADNVWLKGAEPASVADPESAPAASPAPAEPEGDAQASELSAADAEAAAEVSAEDEPKP